MNRLRSFRNLPGAVGKVTRLLLALAALFHTSTVDAQNTHRANLVRAQSQFFTAPDSPSLSITGDLTIEAWVKDRTPFTNGDVRAVVTKLELTGSGSYRSYSFKRQKDAGGVKNLVAAISITGTNDTEQYLPYAFDDSGAWTHYAVVFTASLGRIDFFVNGVNVGNQTGYPNSIPDSNVSLKIGASFDGQQLHDGSIDEVRIWAAARTQSQIRAAMFNELLGTEVGLRGYWRFNNSLTDSSGNGNHLVNVNAATFATTDLSFANSASALEWCPDKDSKALWHFNANASDSSASANNGTANAITFAASNGRFSEGAGFNGTSSHIQMTAVPIVGNDISMSFGCWFKTTSPARQSLIEFGDINTFRDYPQLQIGAEAPGQISFDFNQFPGVRPAASFSDGQWHFVVATVSGGTTVKLYVDGIDLGSNSTSGLRVGNTGTVYKQIGRAFAGQSYFNGSIDEVFVTSRVLSSEEIMKYQGGIVSARFVSAKGAASPVDGGVERGFSSDNTWSNLHDGVGNQGGAFLAPHAALVKSGISLGTWFTLVRSIHLFNTSGLPDFGIQVSRASLNIYCEQKINTLQATAIHSRLHLVSSNPVSPAAIIPSTDYSTLGSVSLGFLEFSKMGTASYNDLEISDAALVTINTLGLTKLGIRLGCDLLNEPPNWGGPNAFMGLNYSSADSTENFPYLLVEYNAPSPLADSDGDGMSDEWEMQYFGNLAQGESGNPDTDGLTNLQEYYLGTNPTLSDTDGDGLGDGAEYNTWGTNPRVTDSDFDGMPDKWETDNGLDPRRNDAGEDRDGDGLTNLQEFNGGTNPSVSDNASEKAVIHFYDSLDRLVATTYSNGGWMAWRYDANGNILKQKLGTVRDADGDGLPDGWEFAYGLDATPAGGLGGDPDGDGWTNVQEFLAGSSPVNAASAPSAAGSIGAVWFTAPTAHLILPPANGGGIAIVTARVWDSEGNPAQFALQWFDAVLNIWKNATLVSVDSNPFAPGSTLATSPAGILHTFRWNTVVDFPGGKNGSLLIRLSVTDAAGTTISPSTPYSVNNTGDTDGDGLPDWWEVPRGLDPNDASGVSGAYGNPDGDGFVNFAEFAFGLNPLSFDSIGAPTVTAEVNPADGKTYLTLTYPRRTDAPTLIYEIQTTTNLATWTTTGADIEPISTAPGGSSLEIVKVRIHPALGSSGTPVKFVRLRVRTP